MIGLREYDAGHSATELPENPLKEWRRQFEASNLVPGNLMEYFQAASPFFFTIDHTGEYSDLGRCSFDEQGAKNAIIDVIEEFIFGDNPQTILDKIKAEENASTVCGRVFKMGEPFYSCRECGMDPTCVLCVNCFKQSAHRHHKYKMGTSGGGGCCDCGDNEAWKQDHYCDEHKQGSEKILQSTVITERMRDRCMIVFDAILNYCVRSLKIDVSGCMKGLDGDLEEDIYCTVLYNDETHTFDQVIQTLTRIVGWQQKDAIEYVSTIDREGRAVVKCSTFQSCVKLKSDIEKQSLRPTIATKPTALKVAVLHKNAVAYQQFSLQLLAWFQEFLSRHAVFRFLFCEILKQNTDYNLRDILLNDSTLWKTARTCWHHLLISGMLMEYENKKALAVMFTKQYTRIMQAFINDDHDHSFSIVSMSVQLFTVPSVAQHLIANESAFYKLLYTFYSESIETYVKKKILVFARNTGNMNKFKRAAYILYDLKYILSFKPDVWTDDLRKNFLHGVQLLIKVLREMQGMDSVYRQTGQHMEYEPEWESAFNLHIKLAPVISLVLDWCSSDRVVLIKVYRMVLASLTETDFIVSQTSTEVKELADHSALCLMYDVSAKPVSIHLPLTRFFAGLYLHLEKFDLTFDSISTSTTKPTPEQIIEPVLCTLTMIAQVHAGLWRRNGYSLLNQLYFYRNVKCRAEMLDRDIVILQIGSSLIESNEFMIHIMNKFNLINWANADYETNSLQNPEEDSIRQVINMVDEMLELIIVVVGERHVPGIGTVTEEDKIKKEIIQGLCIKPFSHSELSRTLPDVQHDDCIEDIIESVAVFKKPTQSDKMGVYELKPQYFDDYNMYFYHYTKEEKSKSEEEQRKRRKAKKELVCCPPPKLPQLTPLFSMLANLLQCDVMLLIMQTILKRAIDLKARSFSESHLQKVLHLVGYAVQEQESGAYPFFQFYERAAKWNILSFMEELVNSARVEAHRDLILWTVRKYKELQPLNPDHQVMDSEESGASGSVDKCTEVRNTADAEKAEKEDRARMAAERRAQIMAQMANAQKSFMSTNAELFESTATAAQDKNETTMEWQEDNELDSKSICLGPNRKYRYVEDPIVACILCSEDAVVNKSGPCMVYSAFIQKSTVLSRSNDLAPSPHSSTCGHVMHATCWKEYFNNEVMKENRRPNRNRLQGITTDKKEFLCPLCRCLSNAVLPIAPALSRVAAQTNQSNPSSSNDQLAQFTSNAIQPIGFDKWLYFMQNYNSALQLITDLPEVTSETADIASKFPDLKPIVEEIASMDEFLKLAQPSSRDLLSADLKDYVIDFINSAKRAAPYPFVDEKTEPHLVTWMSCSYTIQSLEMYLRALNKPLKGQMSIRQTSCLSGLIRVSGLLVSTINDEIAAKLLIHLRSQLSTLFTNSGSCFIEWDLFKMLITFVFITPSVLYAKTEECIVPNGTLLEHYLLKMVFSAVITKILILHNVELTDEIESEINQEMDIDENVTARPSHSEETKKSDAGTDSESETDVLIEFYNNHNYYVIDARDASRTAAAANRSRKELKELLIKIVHNESKVFLRCACLLFQFLTDIELPDELFDSDGDSFAVMCEYLGLSSDIDTYLQCDSINSFMTNLAMHPDVELYRTRQRSQLQTMLVPCVSPIRKLVDLPTDYSDLINTVLTFSCPNNDRDDSRNPTMCLVCGITLCSMTYCCQYDIDGTTVGACTYHAHVCGAGVGIFLRIRECEILLLGLNKGSFVSPPYLDKYGESDQGLRRGNPLKLCTERYQKLNLLWLNHCLHEDIARSAEAINNVIPTQWQHL